MAIDTNKTINDTVEKISNVPIVNKIIANPLYTAFAIVVIMMIISMIVFRNVEINNESDSVFKLSMRASLYSLLFVAGLVFLNNQYLIDEERNINKIGAYDDMFKDNLIMPLDNVNITLPSFGDKTDY